jgi:hypothetical protein
MIRHSLSYFARRRVCRAATAVVVSGSMLMACRGAPVGDAASAVQTAWRGKWNYVQPNAGDDTNIGHLVCADGFSLTLPQIGWIEVTQANGSLSATTDQGCTWTFVTRKDGADLSPPSQTCFNKYGHLLSSPLAVFERTASAKRCFGFSGESSRPFRMRGDVRLTSTRS